MDRLTDTRPATASQGAARPRAVRTRLAVSYGLVILVTGLLLVALLAAAFAYSYARYPPVLSLVPGALYIHLLEPDPLAETPAGELGEWSAEYYGLRGLAAGEFDRLWYGDAMERLAAYAFGAGGLVVVAALSASYVLARRVTSPLGAFARAAQEVSAATLDQRLEHPGTDDELGQLADSFNAMLDRMQASFADLEVLTSYVSHELRTSLSVIRTQLEVGLNGSRDLRLAAQQALAATERTSLMVDDVLSLASRSIPEPPAPVDLALIAAQAVDEYARPDRRLELDLPPDGVPPVMGHETWLYRAAVNLLDNAFKYGPPGGPVLVRLRRRSDAVILEVRDQGPGISPADHDRIWQRWARGGTAPTTAETALGPASGPAAVQGHGIGLALVRQAAEAAGGLAWLKSEPGEGASFFLSLPVAAVQMGAAVTPLAGLYPLPGRLGSIDCSGE